MKLELENIDIKNIKIFCSGIKGLANVKCCDCDKELKKEISEIKSDYICDCGSSTFDIHFN